jgi:hypothetical protein
MIMSLINEYESTLQRMRGIVTVRSVHSVQTISLIISNQ